MSKASQNDPATTLWGSQSWLPAWPCAPPKVMKTRVFMEFSTNLGRLAGGPAADQGVRPTSTGLSTVPPAFSRSSTPGKSRLPQRPAGALLVAALAFAATGCNREHKVTVKETVEEAPGTARIPITVNMGDPKQEKQLVNGFYGIEANSWRWTAKDFSVSLRPPATSAAQGATLDFALSIPKVSIDKLKSLTLTAAIDGTPLAPETYSHDGQYEYKRDVPPNLLKGDSVRVDFHLDKSMPPSGGDARELGIVARSVGLESK